MFTTVDRQFIQDHLHADLHRLLLSAHRYPDVNVPGAIAQIEALRKIQIKVPSWFRFDLIMPPVLSVEQASSEATARFKSSLFSDKSMVDLTGGMGIDDYYFAQRFEQLIYVEQNPALVEIARHNFDVLGAKNINAIQAEAVNFIEKTQEHFDLIYLDPGRRSKTQSRVFQLSDCQPNILQIKKTLLEKTNRVLLKTAPFLDLFEAVQQLEFVSHIWVVSVAGECKEVLYLLEKKAVAIDQVPIEAVCLGAEKRMFRFSRAAEQAAQPAYSPPLQFLYEPDAAVLKAGAFKTFASRYGLHKLHPNTHLYTSETYVPDVPGRQFFIEKTLKYDRKQVREAIPEGRANIAVRNFPDSVAQMRKKLGLADGGERYVFGVTDSAERRVLLVGRKVLDKVS